MPLVVAAMGRSSGKKLKRYANLCLVTTGLDPVVHAEVQLLRVFQ